MELNLGGLEQGRYKVEYSFQTDFNGQKDKPINYKITGDLATDEFSAVIGVNTITNDIPIAYGYYVDVTEVMAQANLTWGIMFEDQTGGNGFVIDFVDLMTQRVGDIPTP